MNATAIVILVLGILFIAWAIYGVRNESLKIKIYLALSLLFLVFLFVGFQFFIKGMG